MNYYLKPLPPLDTAHDHFGIVLSFLAIAMVFILCAMFDPDEKLAKKIGIVGIIAIIISTIISFSTGTIIEYPNTEVASRFVQFIPEVSKNGKHDHHEIYAEFQTPDGNIILSVPEGFPVKNIQILYKN